MIRFFPCNIVIKSISFSTQNITFYRTVRTITRRGTEPKFLKGKVKITTEFDSNTRLSSVGEFAQDVVGNELDVEKAFLEEGDFGHAIEKCDYYYNMHISEEKYLKSKVKKHIIGRKYFKLDKETNLLTYAAKAQIHFLHQSDPVQWNFKAIAECFPISEAGAKKLLKCNFVPTVQISMERIKAHDEDVAKKWEILKSGKFTNLIAPKTWQLYKEGKLVDDYFSGNPNLPTAPPAKIIQLETKQNIGEFSAIIKKYVDYKKQKLLNSKDTCSETQVSLRENSKMELTEQMNVTEFRKFKHVYEDIDNENSEIFAVSKESKANDADLPLSQFKEILEEEGKSSSRKNDYLTKEILEAINSNQDKLIKGSINSKVPCDTHNCFMKISKYNKTDDVRYDKNEQLTVYKYDEKLGYQHPYGKVIKGNISIPSKKHKKGKFYKVGKYVYDDNGELLYKLPA